MCVGFMPLILIEAPSSAYHRSMLALGKQPQEEEETPGDSTPSRTSFPVASTCTPARWLRRCFSPYQLGLNI
jgi:hypothetical protein